MKKFYVEKFNASDDSFRITEIYKKSGASVSVGEIVFSIESSKADIDVEVNLNGFIFFNNFIGDTINVGDLFYIISDDDNLDLNDLFKSKQGIIEKGYAISKKAGELMDLHNISPQEINKKIIKEADVLNYISNSKNDLLVDHILNPGNKKAIIIIGAGGGAKMCIDSLRNSDEFKVVGLLDDSIDLGSKILGISVVGKINCVDKLLLLDINNFVLAFGVLENRTKRYNLYKSLKGLGCNFPNIIHPSAIVENSVSLGEGNVILAGANVGSCAELGNLNYINNNSLISHDCILHDNIHIAPSAVLASSILIESHVLIGMNCTLYYGIKIGESSTILNGLVINQDVGKYIIQKISN